ncbi:transposase [Roseovarius sp.]|uniref:transposase n=1 Tax=Roseovarius sp. TaxID=1486281 RepID=UPI003A97B591
MDRSNQVWCWDITYLPMRRGFLYLVAIMDWHTRKVLACRISNTLEAGFCVVALNEAIHKFGPPEIMNTDQGVAQIGAPARPHIKGLFNMQSPKKGVIYLSSQESLDYTA